MTGGRTARRARAGHLGAALVGLLALFFLLVGGGVLPSPEGLLVVTLPRDFWALLSLIVVLGYLGYFTMTRATSTSARRLQGPRAAVMPGPEGFPPADIPGTEPSPADPGRATAAPPATLTAAPAARTDWEISRLIDWLDGISAQISQWSPRSHASSPAVPSTAESTASLVVEAASDPGPQRAGAWTELRARTAIEKFLRKRPWAPPTDIARALHMDVGLVTRVTDWLREDGGP